MKRERSVGTADEVRSLDAIRRARNSVEPDPVLVAVKVVLGC